MPLANTSDSTSIELDLDGLSELLNYQLRMAHVAMFRDFDETMGDLDLTQRQWQTLHLVGANPGVSQVDLASTLGTDRATMLALTDRLEQRALIQRTRSVIDRRRQELRITKAGKVLLARAKLAIAEHERHFRSVFTEKEMTALVAALARIRQQVRLGQPNLRKGGRAIQPAVRGAKRKSA
jgi:DNA-binding MarR family transcriptional regulator